jgi:uncharacterized protein YbjT (DUF2867 family)
MPTPSPTFVCTMLTDDGHAGRPDEAAGPRISTFDGAVERLAEATGRRISYVRVSTERAAALLADHDVPDEVVARLTRVLATLLDSGNVRLTLGVERAEPRDFADRARLTLSSQVPHEHPARSRSHCE